jgi:hypothetical protein
VSETWTADPPLVWGLFIRGLGLVYLISFASLSLQMVPAVGSRTGFARVSDRLARLARDFPDLRRFAYFPTLLWLNSSDVALRLLTWIGLAAAGCVVYGGPWSFWALAVCYVCYLSLDTAIALIFPWDCLLFEATLLALFLPATLPLPELAAVSAPAPALAWAYRLLLFRVMFGFGKQKFTGSRKEDLAYLKGFLTNQPLLSPLGWLAQKLPLPYLRAAVIGMFIAEIPLPFLAFVPGWPSFLFAFATVLLMIGIQLMGSFGYFSLVTICCSLPLLDSVTPGQLVLSQMFAWGQPVLANCYVIVHSLASLVVLPWNSWLGQSWMLWSFWYQLPRFVLVPLWVFQALHPFRWLHPYGVFPPNNQPGAKVALLLELSWDLAQWHEVEFKYAPSGERSKPRFIAPHHPRGDQAVIYDTFGLNPSSLVSAMLGPWDPSFFASRLAAESFCQQILDGSAPPLETNAPEALQGTKPLAARLTTVLLEPVSLEEQRQTGRYWKRTYIGPHVPAREHDPLYRSDCFGEPELWHFEAIFWRRRSCLRPIIDRAQDRSIDPLTLVCLNAPLSEADVERFWELFVPLVNGPVRQSLDNLPQVVRALEDKFSRQERRTLYRLLNRLALVLVSRLEPLYLHHGTKPQIPVPTYFHLWMLAHHIICSGKQAYLAAVAEPRSVIDHIPQLTDHTGLFALCLFRYQEAIFESQKLRLIEAFQFPHDPVKKRANAELLRRRDFSGMPKLQGFLLNLSLRVSGFFNVMPTLLETFQGPTFNLGYPELYPSFEELSSGEVVVTSYGTVTPDTPLASDLKSLPSG